MIIIFLVVGGVLIAWMYAGLRIQKQSMDNIIERLEEIEKKLGMEEK